MFEHDVNSQEFPAVGMTAAEETGIGGHEGVVDSQESQYDEEFYLDDDGHEEAVDPHSSDGEEEGSEEGENDPAPATQGRAIIRPARTIPQHGRRGCAPSVRRMSASPAAVC